MTITKKKKIRREKNQIELLITSLQQIPIAHLLHVKNSYRFRNVLMKVQRLLGHASCTAA